MMEGALIHTPDIFVPGVLLESNLYTICRMTVCSVLFYISKML